jgi:hypothetical protein
MELLDLETLQVRILSRTIFCTSVFNIFPVSCHMSAQADDIILVLLITAASGKPIDLVGSIGTEFLCLIENVSEISNAIRGW